MLQLFRLPIYYSPETPVGTGTTTVGKDLSKEDIIDFLDDEQPAKDDVIPLEDKPKKDKEIPKEKEDEEEVVEEDEEEEKDELTDLEEELNPPTEEQLELVTPVRRSEILKKYPTIFKDFPYLEKAYYREQQFTEILSTIEDAKIAVDKAKILDNFEADVSSGNTETILKAVKASNEEGFNKIVDNYLETLLKVDDKAYFHVIGNLTKHTIVTMVQEARRMGVGQDSEGKPLPGNMLQEAAHILNQFIFGTSDFKPPTKLSGDKPAEKPNQPSEREQTLIRTNFENARNDLNTRVNNTLKNTIEANIDPKKSMTDYVKRNASRDAMDQLEQAINQDPRFRNIVDKLWDKAFQNNFSKESIENIKRAYTSKAKTLLPSVIKKARNEAYKGMGRRVSEEQQEDATPRRGPVTPERPRSQNRGGKITNPKDIPKGTTTLDFLNSD